MILWLLNLFIRNRISGIRQTKWPYILPNQYLVYSSYSISLCCRSRVSTVLVSGSTTSTSRSPPTGSSSYHAQTMPTRYLSIYLSFYLSIYLSIYLYLFIYLFIYVSIHLSIYLSILQVRVSNFNKDKISLNSPQSFLLSKNGADGNLQCKMVNPSGKVTTHSSRVGTKKKQKKQKKLFKFLSRL